MRKYLTISEVSKLLNISAHTIRYYDKEELISTKHQSENGYRLFDYDDVFTLNAIILLRESGIPIKNVKALLNDYSKDRYKDMLNKSYVTINEEIKKLQKLRKEINQTLRAVSQYENIDKSFSLVELPKRYFRKIKTSDYDMNYSLKELYDVYIEKGINMSSLYKSDFVYVLKDDHISLCIEEVKLDSEDIEIYDAGKYIDYAFVVEEENEVFDRIKEMFEYFAMNDLDYERDMLMIIGVNASMMEADTYIAHLQMKIKN